MGWEERKPVNNGGKEKIKIPATVEDRIETMGQFGLQNSTLLY